MHALLETLRQRHSSRGIAEEDLRQVLQAARWAPTAHNMQNFEIIVVDDR